MRDRSSNIRYAGRARAIARAGFTLVEMMLVIVILGMMAAVAVPALERSRGVVRSAEVDQLMGMMRDARARAMATGMAHGVLLELRSDRSLRAQMRCVRVDETTVSWVPLVGMDGVAMPPTLVGAAGAEVVVVELHSEGVVRTVHPPASSALGATVVDVWFDADGLMWPRNRNTGEIEPDATPLEAVFVRFNNVPREGEQRVVAVSQIGRATIE